MTGTRLNDCTPTPDEKARYKNSDSVLERAPPADVMERAHKVISDWRPDWPIAAIGDATKLIQILVRALTAYGDQRAREAEAAMRDKLLDHADACVREARAAAIEAAAQAIPDNYKFSDYPELQSSARHGVDVFRRMIRALATASPQSEGGEG